MEAGPEEKRENAMGKVVRKLRRGEGQLARTDFGNAESAKDAEMEFDFKAKTQRSKGAE
jgi:hypothetical protein